VNFLKKITCAREAAAILVVAILVSSLGTYGAILCGIYTEHNLLFVLPLTPLTILTLYGTVVIGTCVFRLMHSRRAGDPYVIRIIEICEALILAEASDTKIHLSTGPKQVSVERLATERGTEYNITVANWELYYHEDGDRHMHIVTHFRVAKHLSNIGRNMRFTNIPKPGLHETLPTDEIYKMWQIWKRQLPRRRRLEQQFKHASEDETEQLIEDLAQAAAWQGIALDG